MLKSKKRMREIINENSNIVVAIINSYKTKNEIPVNMLVYCIKKASITEAFEFYIMKPFAANVNGKDIFD